MTTVRQIERQWNARGYVKLSRQLLNARPEASFSFSPCGIDSARTAALALIRLEELTQSHVPLAARLVQTLVTTQECDGGWGDPATTALCLRALLCSRGEGASIDRGMAYLANLQKDSGLWPAEPLRRMPDDPKASAFILYQLGDSAEFRSSVRFAEAIGWFTANARLLEPTTAIEWERAAFKCRRWLNAGFAATMS